MDYEHVICTVVLPTLRDAWLMMQLRHLNRSVCSTTDTLLHNMCIEQWLSTDLESDVHQSIALHWLALPVSGEHATRMKQAVQYIVRPGRWNDAHVFQRSHVLKWALETCGGWAGWLGRVQARLHRVKRKRELQQATIRKKQRACDTQRKRQDARNDRLHKLFGDMNHSFSQIQQVLAHDARLVAELFGDFLETERMTPKTKQRDVRGARLQRFLQYEAMFEQWMRTENFECGRPMVARREVKLKMWHKAVTADLAAGVPSVASLFARMRNFESSTRANIEKRLTQTAIKEDNARLTPDARRQLLQIELAKHGCVLRSDSKICSEFIRSAGTARAEDVAKRMALMRWLYEYKNFKHLLETRVESLAFEEDEYGYIHYDYYPGIHMHASRQLVSEMEHTKPTVWPWLMIHSPTPQP